ncbi:MAG: Ni/Fe hydrogenase subunit alpha [Candidatus Woesearchaeota archaeon]
MREEKEGVQEMTRTIKLDHVTKIEGHAKLHIRIDKGEVKEASLNIFEGSRYFEGILKNKLWNDLPNISSRICGVCSPVHTLTSVKAIENAFGVRVSPQTSLLRELINIGGLIQSHVLHLYFLTLPDYTGHSSALDMLPKYKPEIEKALRIKRAGNAMVNVLGGRDIHPIAVIPGGISRIPDQKAVDTLLTQLLAVQKDAKETVELFSELNYPHFEHQKLLVALGGGAYFDSSDIVACQEDKCFQTKDYEQHFKEFFQEDSTAEFVMKDGKSYMVGALSRLYNNKDQLSNYSIKLADKLLKHKFSPYMNNIAQAIEVHEGVRRSIEILENMKLKQESPKLITPKASIGVGASEAPRGILFHKYKFDKDGKCTYANITTPTSQNLLNLQESIKIYLPTILNKSKDEIKLELEKLIRAYDPCISCSTHFLELDLEKV